MTGAQGRWFGKGELCVRSESLDMYAWLLESLPGERLASGCISWVGEQQVKSRAFD